MQAKLADDVKSDMERVHILDIKYNALQIIGKHECKMHNI